MRFAQVKDGLLSRPDPNVVIDPAFPSTPLNIGEGDFGVIRHDGFFFMYLMQSVEGSWGTIVARSKSGGPGTWAKWYEGQFSEPGIGGKATQLGYWGTWPAKYTNDEGSFAVLFAEDPWFKGLRVSFGQIPTGPFASLKEPLLPFDNITWHRPAPSELHSYSNVVNGRGGKEFSRHTHLFSTIVLPNDGFDRKWLLRRDVWWTMADSPQPYSVRLRLARYEHDGESWATTGFAQGHGAPQKHLGYVLTSDGENRTRLLDCVENKDHFLAEDCGAGRSLRTVGWLFASIQENTRALFSCRGKERFVSLRKDCEKKGKLKGLLGFVLVK